MHIWVGLPLELESAGLRPLRIRHSFTAIDPASAAPIVRPDIWPGHLR